MNDPLVAGHEALSHGAWDEAYAFFKVALRAGETPEALEGLGMAAWWRDDAAITFDSRKRAYHLYRLGGNDQSAARMATYLAYDYFSFRGEYAVASGWLQRARRLLERFGLVPERALLAIFDGYIELMARHDTATAQRLGAQAAKDGRELGVVDLEMLALALEGLARVCAGDVATGMRCLDESTTAAVSGEMTDLDARMTACCYLIYACEMVRDYDRAAQWCSYIKELSTRWKYPLIFSYCRIHYAGVLIWRGNWAEAETLLVAATNDLVGSRPGEAAEGILRLADLRRRQGRYDEAVMLLSQAESHPFRILGGNKAMLGRAALAFDLGEPATAVDLADRFLRSLPTEDRTERSVALELLVLAQTALGDRTKALISLAELDAIASTVGTEPLRAASRFAAGHVAAANGEHKTARRRFEDAVDLYKRSGASFETAQARIGLAHALLALGRTKAAKQQAQKAQETLDGLGAGPATDRAATFLRRIEAPLNKQIEPISGMADLTLREIEVLRLIADGKSNQEIAAILVVSVRTVERHISNIYAKIGVSGAVARASATAYALHHDLNRPHKL